MVSTFRFGMKRIVLLDHHFEYFDRSLYHVICKCAVGFSEISVFIQTYGLVYVLLQVTSI